MKLNLAQINYEKFDWISHMSLSFALHDGYLAHDSGDEIEVILHNVYDSEARIVLRDYKYNDAVVLYSAISNDIDSFLTEIINKTPISGIISVVDMDAGIGIKAIWLAKYLITVRIMAIESNELNFRQLEKNIALNKDVIDVITPYRSLNLELFDIKSLDILICSSNRLNNIEHDESLVYLVAVANIIVANEFLNTDSQNDFADRIKSYGFEYKHFDQYTILWKI